MRGREEGVHDRAMRRFASHVEPQMPVRELALAARRFADVPGATWEGAAGDQYGDSIKLEFPKLKRALRKLENDFRQNRIVPDFRPSTEPSDQDTADTLNGMHRADSYYFKSQAARDNARSEAGKGGFGAYRLLTDWADPLDKDSDHQRVNPASLIADADQCVFFGPSALYDKSDAKYAYILVSMSPEEFADEYGEDKDSSWPDAGSNLGEFEWYRPESVTVCEYYEVEDSDETVVVFEQKVSGEEHRFWESELDADEAKELKQQGYTRRTRSAKRRRCHKWVLSGTQVLEGKKEIPGGAIPIVPVYGERAYVDGVEWFRGLVQQNMDMVRVFNAVMSNLYEITTMAPYERPIFAPEQMPSTLAELWRRGNIDRHPYALVNPLLDPITGGIAVTGPIGKVEPPQVPATLAAMVQMLESQFSDDDQDPDEVRSNVSADAMDIAAARVDAKSGVYLDNGRLSTQREGEIYLSMAREVYVEEGRQVETMTTEGDDGKAKLYEDYSDNGDLKQRNDFANGRYKVIASVTEATATRRDRTVKQMLSTSELAGTAGDQELAQAALITAVSNMDGEGVGDLKKWNRRRGIKMGLFEPSDAEKSELAEQAKAQGPDPQQIMVQGQMQKLQADVRKAMADAGLSEARAQEIGAKIQQELSDAMLKQAQATAVGGPDEVPDTPTGLQAANDAADVKQKDARADLHYAQAEQIRQETHEPHIAFGYERNTA